MDHNTLKLDLVTQLHGLIFCTKNQRLSTRGSQLYIPGELDIALFLHRRVSHRKKHSQGYST